MNFVPLILGALSGLVAGDFKSVPKVEYQPPSWVFGPVWTVLYLLMGIAASQVQKRTGAIPLIFWVQLALNLVWSPVYVRFRNPKLAMGILIALWVCILATIHAFGPSGKLLWPYLAWVSFAGFLNYKSLGTTIEWTNR